MSGNGDLMTLATAAANYSPPPFASEREIREMVDEILSRAIRRRKRKSAGGAADDALLMAEKKRLKNEILRVSFDRREFLWTEAEHEALLRAYTRWTFNNVFQREHMCPFAEFARLTEPLLAHRRLDAIHYCRIPWPNLLKLEARTTRHIRNEKREGKGKEEFKESILMGGNTTPSFANPPLSCSTPTLAHSV